MKKRWYFGSRAIAPSTYYVTTGKYQKSEKVIKKLQKKAWSESDTPFVFNYFCSNKDLNFYKAELRKAKKLNS